MLNTKLFSIMFIALLSLSGYHVTYGSSVSDKEDEKSVRSHGVSGVGAEVLSAEDKFKKCFKAAQDGNPQSEYELGQMYYWGEGVEEDIKQAAHLYQMSAEKGYARAQCTLGNMYYSGDGIVRDLKIALHYLQLSAVQGNALAQYSLGSMYGEGKGVPQNFEEAFRYYKLSAEQGYVYAQRNLGDIHYYGEGVPQDLEEAFRYFKLSADQGDALAQYNLGKMYYLGEGVEKDLEKAADYLRLSAKQKNYDADELLEKVAPLMRQKAGALLLESKKNAQIMKDLVEIRSTDIEESEQNHIRTHMVYWIKLKEMTGRKLFENGNKFREKNPQYAADCYLESSDANFKAGKSALQNIRKSLVYKECFSCFDLKMPCHISKSVEYYVAIIDILDKEKKLEESASIKTAPRSTAATQPVVQKKKKLAPASVAQEVSLASKNKKLSNPRELHEDRGELRKPDLLFTLGSQQPPQDKENNPMRHSPRGRSVALSGLSKRDALIKPALSLTPVVAIPAVMNTRTASTTTTTQEDVRIFNEPEKKEKRTLRLKNPLRRGGLYSMFKKETKEDKEARRIESRKKRVLGESFQSDETLLTSSVTQSFLDSQSHFSITESAFDEEESQVSQSMGPVDDVQARVKFFYPHLWRMIRKTPAQHLDQIKIKSSNEIRSVLKILDAKKLMSGTVKRGNIHVSKVGDQNTAFVAHTTHGSGAHARWYQNPAVVVSFFTFVAKCDPDLRDYFMSKFGQDCFSRDMGGDDVDGTTSPEPK